MPGAHPGCVPGGQPSRSPRLKTQGYTGRQAKQVQKGKVQGQEHGKTQRKTNRHRKPTVILTKKLETHSNSEHRSNNSKFILFLHVIKLFILPFNNLSDPVIL